MRQNGKLNIGQVGNSVILSNEFITKGLIMWILILFAHVGVLGKTDSNALTTAVYTSQQTCEAAGKAAKSLTSGTVKNIEWVCTKQ